MNYLTQKLSGAHPPLFPTRSEAARDRDRSTGTRAEAFLPPARGPPRCVGNCRSASSSDAPYRPGSGHRAGSDSAASALPDRTRNGSPARSATSRPPEERKSGSTALPRKARSRADTDSSRLLFLCVFWFFLWFWVFGGRFGGAVGYVWIRPDGRSGVRLL